MARKQHWTAIAAFLLVIVVSSAASAAVFVNGDFETGDFTGWTQTGGLWKSGTAPGTAVYSPGENGSGPMSAIVSVGDDPIVAGGGGVLPMVYSGNYSARVNSSQNGYHYSTLSQTVQNWSATNLYFAWAAVLEDPGHPEEQEPHFSLQLDDLTKNTTLYSEVFNSDTIPANIVHTVASAGSTWKYTDWQVANLDTSADIGDTLQLTLLAADCALGGHGGYAYLDGFGDSAPVASGAVPEPCALCIWSLLGVPAIGLGWWRKVKRA